LRKTLLFIIVVFSICALSAEHKGYSWIDIERIENADINEIELFNTPVPQITGFSNLFYQQKDNSNLDIVLLLEIKSDGLVGNISEIEKSNNSLIDIIKTDIKKWTFIPASDIKGNLLTTWNKFDLNDYLKYYYFDSNHNKKDVSPDFDSPPKPKKQVAPKYSIELQEKSIEGIVLLHVFVSNDGSVGDILILNPLHPDLDNNCVETVRKWTFKPAKYNRKPVAVWITFPIEFKKD